MDIRRKVPLLQNDSRSAVLQERPGICIIAPRGLGARKSHKSQAVGFCAPVA